jgi:hypothetical protein
METKRTSARHDKAKPQVHEDAKSKIEIEILANASHMETKAFFPCIHFLRYAATLRDLGRVSAISCETSRIRSKQRFSLSRCDHCPFHV